jgi:tetratricopeptide (TPR) repeat protein
VNNLLVGLLGTMIATNQPQAVSNLLETNLGISVDVAAATDPVDAELAKVMAEDDAAQAEVDVWIREHKAFQAEGAGLPDEVINERILKRFESVRQSYEAFLEKHPDHAPGHLAYASFLYDIGREPESRGHLDKATQLDPNNPAGWNNLANYCGHYGEVKKAFEYYAKAIALKPDEPVYYQNFATTVYLFRKDAREHYDITEQEVFDKALDLYMKARNLATNDFPLATDVAMTYYGIKPARTDEALKAWEFALNIANDDIERQGVQIHLARVNIMAERLDAARKHLDQIDLEMYDTIKARLVRNLKEKESPGDNPPNSEVSLPVHIPEESHSH